MSVFFCIFVVQKNKTTKNKHSVMTAKLQQFSELSKFLGEKIAVCNDFISLLGEFRLERALHNCKMEKIRGSKSIDLLRCLLIFRLCGLSIYQSYCQRFGNMIGGGKNQFYRFLTRPDMDWRKLLYRVVQSFISIVCQKSAEPTQWRYAIVDDTTIEKTGSTMEQITKVFDHTSHDYVLGYKLQLLALSDKKTTIPVDFSLHAEQGKNKLGGLTAKQRKARNKVHREQSDCLKKRVSELSEKKTNILVAMLKRMYKYGIRPSVLLMDKWYCSAALIREVRAIAHGAIHVITLLRDKRTKFVVNGKTKNAKQLCKEHETDLHQCRKYRCRYFRVDATMDGIPVRLFFVKYGRNENWEVIVTTLTDISFIKAFEDYQIRWSIEVLFKECKSYLHLGGCQSTNLNAQFADCTLVFIGYTIIALRKRFSDYETFGGLYHDLQVGLLELTLLERILPIIAQILERILILCNTTPEELLECALHSKEANDQLLALLKYHQSVKEQGDNAESGED